MKKKTTNQQVLDLIYERLNIGQVRYKGNIPYTGEKGRDNLKESLEEALDLAVYLAAEIISIKDKRDNTYIDAEIVSIKDKGDVDG